KGDEEQAGVEQAGAWVDPVGVCVAAAQNEVAAIRLRGREADVRVDVDARLAVGGGTTEVRGVELPTAAERGAAGLVTPDHPLLLAERRAVPALDEHADAARDDVGAATEPRLRLVVAPPAELVHLGGVVDAPVARAVL